MKRASEEAAMMPPYVRLEGGRAWLAIKLQPRASRNGIDGPQGAELKVRVTAPPVDSAANEALVRLLAEVLDCSRSQISIVRGQTSRHKAVAVSGVAVAELVRRLESAVNA